MSIEDVDYLYQNSIKESSIILVDSSQRNRDVYHSPNNYTIEFTLPFKYVYGVEVIDSSVPRTMYQIDKFNDTLYFFTSEGGEEFIQLDNRDRAFMPTEGYITSFNQTIPLYADTPFTSFLAFSLSENRIVFESSIYQSQYECQANW